MPTSLSSLFPLAISPSSLLKSIDFLLKSVHTLIYLLANKVLFDNLNIFMLIYWNNLKIELHVDVV